MLFRSTGISEVIIHRNGQDFYDSHSNGQWDESYKRTLAMLEEAEVNIRFVTTELVAPEIYMNGKIHSELAFLNGRGNG